MPTVYIDGKEYQVKPGRNMLEAAIDNGLNLPYFCWHPAMGSVGACRLCAIKVFKDESDTKGKIQMACMTPALDGCRISMNDPDAVEFRRYVIEWLMTNHPHDCPVCDEGGECHLQDMTAMCGQVYRRFRLRKRTYKNQYLGPFLDHEMNRCIQCYRCTRYYRDLAGGRDLNVFGSKNRVYFGREKDGVLESEFSGNLVEVCPTGVFTDKTLGSHYTRKWDLETAPSVCIHCGIGCNTIPGERYGELRRIQSRFNGDVNGYFLCDRGRFGYEFVNHKFRIREPKINGASAGWIEAIDRGKEILSKARGVIGIGSPRASLEANYALKKLVGDANFSTGLSDYEQENVEFALRVLREGPARTPSLAEIEDADVVLVLGADPTNESPMLDFAIRQAMRKAPLDVARKLKIPDWDANAVGTALQNAKGKLYIAAPWAIKIQEIAAGTAQLSLPNVAKFAEQIQNESTDNELASSIAADLRDARQPLVVTSITAGVEVIKAAANIAWALKEQGKDCWLSIAVPEANTMGVAMMGGISVQNALDRITSGAADTLIVLDNDLSRRTSLAQFESAMNKAKCVIALDCLDTPITQKAEVVLPASAYVETDGTFVNNEGRAQRFFQVFVPRGDLRADWQSLQELSGTDNWSSFEDVLRDLVKAIPEFAPALDAAPSADWRSPAGRKIARMPHRYSGRTAKDANVTIREPRPPDDPQTPFAFSMEGDQNLVPGPLVPRFWYPGWNSEAAINKFQIEVGGPLHGGNPGKRLIEPSQGQVKIKTRAPELLRENEVWLIPRPRIFGSEELSQLSPPIMELKPPVEITINPELAKKLGLTEGHSLEFEVDGQTMRLPARLDDSIAIDVASVPANFSETRGIYAPVKLKIARAK